MENRKEIERIARGVYASIESFEDAFYSFQSRYKKTIFSHMTALYFYGLTDEQPFSYTVTVPRAYHVNEINDSCNVFYVDDSIYALGLMEIETSNGNMVRAYDVERSICDIIKSKNRMDIEQVKKTVKKYVKSMQKNIMKLSEYADKLGIRERVMEMVGRYYD